MVQHGHTLFQGVICWEAQTHLGIGPKALSLLGGLRAAQGHQSVLEAQMPKYHFLSTLELVLVEEKVDSVEKGNLCCFCLPFSNTCCCTLASSMALSTVCGN